MSWGEQLPRGTADVGRHKRGAATGWPTIWLNGLVGGGVGVATVKGVRKRRLSARACCGWQASEVAGRYNDERGVAATRAARVSSLPLVVCSAHDMHLPMWRIPFRGCKSRRWLAGYGYGARIVSISWTQIRKCRLVGGDTSRLLRGWTETR